MGDRKLNSPVLGSTYLQYKSTIVLVDAPALTFGKDRLESRATAEKCDRTRRTVDSEGALRTCYQSRSEAVDIDKKHLPTAMVRSSPDEGGREPGGASLSEDPVNDLV
ncbi:hypothetical protein RRF57_001225 [Xylaria bambusicola]|uniref:Uncharacterized protein n=1 Tax=Xylaria bambusicola TaxID=326684 RepID=A0AAN7U563_9PEZI